MAVLHQATLVPSKIELFRRWVPGQPWLGGADASTVESVGAFRFDDPAGQVGIETHLLRTADNRTIQVPVTYRAEPTAGAESSLIGTMQHSVLGERWVYDACGDPVYVQAVATAIWHGGTQAELEVVTATGRQRREPTTLAWGSGSSDVAVETVGSLSASVQGTVTVVRADQVELTVMRVVEDEPSGAAHDGTQRLVGTWPGHEVPAVLVLARIG